MNRALQAAGAAVEPVPRVEEESAEEAIRVV